MRNEMLNELKLEDLQGEARELAETIGMDAFRRLVDVYGGTGRVYIPQADKLLIPIRDRLIRDNDHRDNGGGAGRIFVRALGVPAAG